MVVKLRLQYGKVRSKSAGFPAVLQAALAALPEPGNFSPASETYALVGASTVAVGTKTMLARTANSLNPTMKMVLDTPYRVAPVVGALMTPIALSSYVLAFWRLAADLNWAGEFFISRGLFSRWQVWLAMAIAIHAVANQLTRTRPDDTVAS